MTTKKPREFGVLQRLSLGIVVVLGLLSIVATGGGGGSSTTATTSSSPQNVTVTCGSGTIAAALANAPPGGRLTITVNGTCTENVTIERDLVTLKDGTVAGTGAAQPVIQILGARGIVIDNMTVQGGASHGIEATRRADVTITNSLIQNNTGYGVRLRWGAHGDISGSTITGNVQCAVGALDAATVVLTNNSLTTAQPNPDIGSTIGGYRKTTIFLNGGNTVTNTGGGGLAMEVNQGSAVRAQNGVDTITGQILVSRLANVDLRNADITGDMNVIHGSWLRLRAPSSATGNIFISSDSSAQFQDAPTVSGTVTCGVGSSLLFDSTDTVVTAGVGTGVGGPQVHVHEGIATEMNGSVNFTSGGFSNCNF
jgi:hypothetical protein